MRGGCNVKFAFIEGGEQHSQHIVKNINFNVKIDRNIESI
jgi:hypothetical protein